MAVPLATALCLVMGIALLSPTAIEWLGLDLDAIRGGVGQFRRLLTDHLAHFGTEHVLRDVALFAVAGSLLRMVTRLVMAIFGAVSTLVVFLAGTLVRIIVTLGALALL